MKTLDEVIKALEHCTDPNPDPDYDACAKCPYCDAVKGCCRDNAHMTDALQWLKGYRAHIELDKIRDNCEAENEPLSWDELRLMEGKPVWVELTYPEGAYSHWGIIWGFPKAGYEFMELWGFHDIVSFSVMEKEQGKSWQAYRKERT